MNYAQRAQYLKNTRLKFESSMNSRQKQLFSQKCTSLENQILNEWPDLSSKIEKDTLAALDILASVQKNKSPLFQALIFRSKAQRITSTSIQFLSKDERAERVKKLDQEHRTLCETLIEFSTPDPETEEKVLYAIKIIENTMNEICGSSAPPPKKNSTIQIKVPHVNKIYTF